LQVLRQGGRFIEIGKTGIWDAERVAAIRPDVRYFSFDLGEAIFNAPTLYSNLMASLLDGFADGSLSATRTTVFPLEKAVQAFDHLARARNIGKVVLSISSTEKARIRADRTYLVTGGLGVLSLRVAEWLVEEGAGAVVLAGRNRASNENNEAIAHLRKA